ncbi:MAG TPA: sigma-70 family RNA polymerase sigma factor [Candidatus Aminicenantes bacterium]|nr:sigma-70 family RNA polymerase sigma factor [Candidatus Aminicenantes bacterium]
MKGDLNCSQAGQANAPPDHWRKLLEHQELVFRICLGLCRNAADADDMAQETYCKAFSRKDKLEEALVAGYAKLWLCKVARTTCLDHLRKERRRSLFAFIREDEPRTSKDPEWALLRAEEISLFRAALAKLPKKQRDALVLREYGQLSYREISMVLTIKEGSVMSILLRARRRVHAAVREALSER